MHVVVDECVRRSWIDFLDSGGHEAVDWVAVAGRQGAPDDELIAWAKRSEHVVLTADSDLGQIVWSQGASGPSVIQLESPAWRPEQYGVTVLTALQECSEQPSACFFIALRVNGSYRIRRLPIR